MDFIKRIIIGIIIWLAIYHGFFSLIGVAHAYLRFPQNNETVDLDEIIANEEEFPVGEFVTLKVHYPLGVYADDVKAPFLGNKDGSGAKGFSPGTDYYYVTILEDNTFMTLMVGNKEEKLKLDAQLDLVLASSDLKYVPNHVQLTGKLRDFYIEEKEIKGYYEDMIKASGLETTDPRFRMYILDTTITALDDKISDSLKGHPEFIIYIMLIEAGASIICILLMQRQDRRKKME